MLTAKELEYKGEKLHGISKMCLFAAIIAIGLLILSVIGTTIIAGADEVVYLLSFEISDYYFFMYPIVAIIYIGLLMGMFGIPLYFYSLILFGIGKIAVNTEEKTKPVSTAIKRTEIK